MNFGGGGEGLLLLVEVYFFALIDARMHPKPRKTHRTRRGARRCGKAAKRKRRSNTMTFICHMQKNTHYI